MYMQYSNSNRRVRTPEQGAAGHWEPTSEMCILHIFAHKLYLFCSFLPSSKETRLAKQLPCHGPGLHAGTGCTQPMHVPYIYTYIHTRIHRIWTWSTRMAYPHDTYMHARKCVCTDGWSKSMSTAEQMDNVHDWLPEWLGRRSRSQPPID